MRRLPPGHFRVPGSRTLNTALGPFELGVDLAVVDLRAGYTFGRRDAVNDPQDIAKANEPDATEADMAKVRTPDQLAERCTALRASINKLARVFDIRWAPIEINRAIGSRPAVTAVGFEFRPHRLPKDQLVQVASGHGFLPDEYAHGPSLGLVLPATIATDVALLTPFADAPPVFLVYVGHLRSGIPLVVTATAQANWLTIGGGVFDFDGSIDQPVFDLLGRLVASVRSQVEAAGGVYSPNNLYAFVGPGASEEFKIVDKYGRITDADRDSYVHAEEVPTGEGDETKTVEFLNLRGYTAGMLGCRGVRKDRIFVVDHDTVTSDRYSSKRRTIGHDTADGSTPIASNGMVLHIRSRRADDDLLY